MINTRQDNDYWDPQRKGFVTNYPNFMQWSHLDAEEMGDQGPLNIYLHSPYCIQRCSYCYYKTINLRGKDKGKRMAEYIDRMCREIEMASQYYNLKGRHINSIYFGGGTPSLLDEPLLEQVFRTLHDNLTIDKPEICIEAEPVTMTKRKAAKLIELGATRISMGVQSFDNDIIKGSHRLDDEKKAVRAIEIAKNTGAVINIDLMSGLAGETPATWKHSVGTAINLGIQSISVYKTEIYTNTDYYRGLRKGTIDLPSDEQELDYMAYAMDELEAAGYEPWCFYTFTKGGEDVHLHSPSVFRGDDIYSFGVSAFGRLNNYVFQNSNNENRYMKMIDEGRLPVHRGHYLTSRDQMIRDVVLTMKLVSLNLNDFERKYGFRLEALAPQSMNELVDGGYINVSDSEIRLTRKGILHGDFSGKTIARELMNIHTENQSAPQVIPLSVG